MAAHLLSGSCLCGAVRYEVPDAFGYAAICHCSQCRRATDAAAKPFAGIEAAQLRLVAGSDELLRYGDGVNYDIHCARCGSLLYSIVREGAFAHITLGTLLDEPTIRPTEHIFAGSKAGWETIADDLPQYEGHAVGEPMRRI